MKKPGMKLIIVSNGPSAKLYRPCDNMTLDGMRGRTCCVNKAAAKWACDYWAFFDFQTFANIEPIGKPILWTTRHADHHLRTMQPDLIERWDSFEKIYQDHLDIDWPGDGGTLPNRWNAYSGLAALGLGMQIGAEKVVVYGADMAGTKDIEAFDRESDRSPDRWNRERACWNILVNLMAKKGIQVARFVPGIIEELESWRKEHLCGST